MRTPLVIAIVTAASSARANVEFDLLGGGHKFSSTNPYGVVGLSTETEKDAPLFGLRLGLYFADRIGLEGEGALIPTKTVQEPGSVTDITYRGHLLLMFRAGSADNHVIPFLLVGAGMMQIYKTTAITLTKDRDPVAYGGLGLKLRSGGGWNLRLDVRGQFEKSRALSTRYTNDFEGLVSLGKEFGGHGERKVATAAPVEEREARSAVKDTDGDGIPDNVDKCPNEPEDKDGFEDADGCPDPDNDGDGIADTIDKCPNEPEDKDGFEDTDGCPDPDNDQDGIPDVTDKCPNDAETRNGYEDEDGCPDEIPTSLKRITGVVAGIDFKPNTAALTPGATKVLDRAVKVLKGFPRVRLEIAVHTDDQPPPKKSKFADNAALSQARADAIRVYLVKKEIADMRLVAKGYGDTAPRIDPKGMKAAKLRAARAKNRRVELKLIVGEVAAPAQPAKKKDDE